MRIGIDIRSLQNDSQNRGIGAYTRCLIKSLLSANGQNEYVFFAFKNKPLPEFLKEEIFRNVEILQVIPQVKYIRILSAHIIFPYIIAKERLDIFHSLENMVPVFSQTKKLITVHDFIYNDYKVYNKENGLYKNIYFYLRDKTLKYADKIIAVSEYTKKKVMELMGIKKERIEVIYEAASEIFRPIDNSELFLKVREKYHLKSDFILYVGALLQHKNIDGLIRVFEQVSLKDVNLVIVGPKVKDNMRYLKSINTLMEQLRIKDRVYILGYIPQEDLLALYNMAKIFISLSFYEGFGLPVLEAMSCGKPVIASQNTSMQELVGSNGILVDPYNIEEIIIAIENLLSDEKLRILLSKKGLQRSGEFSWDKTARETLSLYEDLLK